MSYNFIHHYFNICIFQLSLNSILYLNPSLEFQDFKKEYLISYICIIIINT